MNLLTWGAFMNSDFVFNSNPITGMQIEENFGKYSMSCKAGNLCIFDLNQISNQPHFHNCFELCIVTAGTGNFIYGDKTYKIAQGDIFIADPNIIHEVQVSNLQNLQLLFFFIDIVKNDISVYKTPEDHIIHSFLTEHKVLVHSQKHLLAYLVFIQNYYSVKKTRGFGVYQALKNLILECMDALSVIKDNFSKSKSFSNSTLELALDYIDRNLNEKIKICDIAKHACSSERNLHHLFKKHLGTTIIDYINEKKVNLASHYLARQFSIRDTALQIGMSDSSQLTRLFKKYKSITPKQYQQLNVTSVKDFGRRQQKNLASDDKSTTIP